MIAKLVKAMMLIKPANPSMPSIKLNAFTINTPINTDNSNPNSLGTSLIPKKP